MITLFVKKKPLFLINSISTEIEEYINRSDTIFIRELSLPAVNIMLQKLEDADFNAGVFLHTDIDELFEVFKLKLILIQAAGGLVYTKEKDVLLIFRKGKWDLPKGKLDAGEHLEACALREIKEETGANFLEIEKPLKISYHIYREKERQLLKESHWYLVKANERSVLQPQTEEDIEKCEWVTLKSVPDYMHNMHASLIDVVQLAINMLNEKD